MRALYPALTDGHAYLDGAAGTQVPVPVIEAIAAAYRGGIGNLGGAFAATQFYADVEAHPKDRPLALALEELAFFSREVKILGVYPAHPLRIAAAAGDAN